MGHESAYIAGSSCQEFKDLQKMSHCASFHDLIDLFLVNCHPVISAAGDIASPGSPSVRSAL